MLRETLEKMQERIELQQWDNESDPQLIKKMKDLSELYSSWITEYNMIIKYQPQNCSNSSSWILSSIPYFWSNASYLSLWRLYKILNISFFPNLGRLTRWDFICSLRLESKDSIDCLFFSGSMQNLRIIVLFVGKSGFGRYLSLSLTFFNLISLYSLSLVLWELFFSSCT